MPVQPVLQRICDLGRAFSGGPPSIDPQIAALGPAQFLQALHERVEARLSLPIVRSQAHQYADTPHPLRLLCVRRKWPRCRCGAE